MNAVNRSNDELGHLAAYVAALQGQTIADTDNQHAQEQLLQRLAAAKPRRERAAPWGWLTAAGVAGLLAILLLPALVIGPTPAFADVLRHFRDFTTLRMHMDMHLSGGPVQRDVITVNQQGDVRVDLDTTMTLVMNREQGRMLHLLHAAKVGRTMPIDAAELKRQDSLRWLNEMRDYQGAATLLPGTRIIDGQQAHGYELTAEGGKTTVWAGADGLPLEMKIDRGELMTIDFRFEFDQPLAADTFSTAVPSGYRQTEDED